MSTQSEEGISLPLLDVRGSENDANPDPFASAAAMEEGHASPSKTNTTNGSETITLESLSRRIDELESGLNAARLELEIGPRVKVTPWRLLNTFLVLGLGVYKSVSTYRGQDTAPTTIDWILGVLWALIAYWISFLENADLGPRGQFFFASDVSGALLPLLLCLIAASIGGLVIWGFIALMIFRADPGSAIEQIQLIIKGIGAMVVYVFVAGFICVACYHGCGCEPIRSSIKGLPDTSWWRHNPSRSHLRHTVFVLQVRATRVKFAVPSSRQQYVVAGPGS
ncbi:hypothetical protein R3P38DRAFT_3594900 [Favolaschia claudopus]|uniref:Yip1 domain-containing protein n=1 Tax=Favolaschia claudopus TaxID=2862362 RepID=A0AAW0DKE0_9AGAR